MSDRDEGIDGQILRALTTTPIPLSGRQVAAACLLSPTTTTKSLRRLEAAGLVASDTDGRAIRWRLTPAASDPELDGAASVTRRVLLITALSVETSALKDALPRLEPRRLEDGTRVLETRVAGRNIAWSVCLVQSEVGNATAAAAAVAIDREVQFDLILFVGVAGGLKPEDSRHGDVVVVTRAYNAASGKEAHRGSAEQSPEFLSRPVSVQASHSLEQLARTVAERTPRGRHAVRVGSVASVDVVLQTSHAQAARRIHELLNDCSIIDMESYGVFVGARRLGIAALSVRGISDFLDDKVPSRDQEMQPLAARNAARIATKILSEAHPSDLDTARAHFEIQAENAAHASETLEHESLPAFVEAWAAALELESPHRAQDARLALLKWRSGAVASQAGRCIAQPPAWLREDVTGHAWAMVAHTAHLAGSVRARQAFDEAARRARVAGAVELAGIHHLQAVLAGLGSETLEVDSDAVKQFRREVQELDLTRSAIASAQREVVLLQVSASDSEWSPVIGALRNLLSNLGHPTGQSKSEREALIAQQVPEMVREALVSRFAADLCYFLLLQDEAHEALVAADLALVNLPGSARARVRRAQALLTVLRRGTRTELGMGDRETLRVIERLALEARSDLREWDADSCEALALAGRARLESGDAQGALRALLPPPQGSATQREAASDETRRIAAAAATISGDHSLALRLAGDVEDAQEAHMARGQALERAPQMHREARAAYFEALSSRGTDRSLLERALFGLARTGVPLHELSEVEGPTSITSEWLPILRDALEKLRRINPVASDLITGRAALLHQDPAAALRQASRHQDTVNGIELVADALEALGRPQRGVDLLWAFAVDRHDVLMMLDCIGRAGRIRDLRRVRDYADTIVRDFDGEPVRQARRARIHVAAMEDDWETVDAQARGLLEDGSSPGGPERAADEYHWMRVEALLHLDRPVEAFRVLEFSREQRVRDPRLARLALATIGQYLEVAAPTGGMSSDVTDMILSIASDWLEEEEIASRAIGLLMTGGGESDVAQVARARDVISQYFVRHGDSAQIKQIDLEGDLDDEDEVPEGYFAPLFEVLRRQAPPQELEAALSGHVFEGRMPLATYAGITRRSYATLLIKPDRRPHIVGTTDSPAHTKVGVTVARSALQQRSTCIDTSALVIAAKLGLPVHELLTEFDTLILPATSRTDILRSRAELNRRSDATIGWDVAANRPLIETFDEKEVEGWAAAAEELASTLPLMAVRQVESTTPEVKGLECIDLASAAGTPLWTDDASMRSFARERGVDAFSSFDLVAALISGDSAPKGWPSIELLLQRARSAWCVDLPLPASWWAAAGDDDWDSRGGVALAISRPAAWQDRSSAFREFQTLINQVAARAQSIGGVRPMAEWSSAAAAGLARATPSAHRAPVVANLLTWVLLTYEPSVGPGRILGVENADRSSSALLLDAIYQVMIEIGEQFFPMADGVEHLTRRLGSAMRTVADASTTVRVLLAALGNLRDQEVRAAATESLLSRPPSPDPLDV